MIMKTIGVLTSGGDSQGMNNAVRSVVRAALSEGFRVMGIQKGYQGLLDGDIEELTATSVSNILNKGGTFLQSARCTKFKEEESVLKAVQTCKDFGIEGLVCVGGDGTFRGARDMCIHGIPCVAIPGTIDNDIVCSDYTIGFDTAQNIVVDLVDKLRDTCMSHDRCSVVQVMGAKAGWLALECAMATGATSVIVPEVEFDFKRDIVDRIEHGKKLGKNFFIVMIAEGVYFTPEKSKVNVNWQYMVDHNIETAAKLARAVEEATGVESRETVLGHVQRGGTPSARDRVTATEMGYYAVQLLKQGISNRVVVIKDSKITDIDILEALQMKKPFTLDRFNVANKINI